MKHSPYYNSVPCSRGDLIDVIAIHQEGYPLHLKLLSKSQSTQAIKAGTSPSNKAILISKGNKNAQVDEPGCETNMSKKQYYM